MPNKRYRPKEEEIKLFKRAIELSQSGKLTRREISKQVGISPNTLTDCEKKYKAVGKLKPHPRSTKSADLTKKEFYPLYQTAKHFYTKTDKDVIQSMAMIKMSRKKFNYYCKKYGYKDIVKHKKVENPIIVEQDKPAIAPDLYALAAMAIGGFQSGFGYRYQNLVGQLGSA